MIYRTEASTFIKDVFYVKGLNHNLLNISQLCDKGYKVNFESENCQICNEDIGKVVFKGKRLNNIYLLNINHNIYVNECLISKDNDSWLWHNRLAHIHTDHLNRLNSKYLVSSLPKIKFENNKICDECQKGKLTISSFKLKDVISYKKIL